MNVGSKYKIVIPADLAYGDNGAPPVIEPGAVLVFEVDLRSIEKPAAKK
jgi:peptidylprolyl isomerase/FKBP-type peptidyl-prolyl cis-trans isomerase FklB